MDIKVLGSGCKLCKELYENVKKITNEEVEYITDMSKIMSYGVMSMPALVINEKVVSAGRKLSKKDIINIIENN